MESSNFTNSYSFFLFAVAHNPHVMFPEVTNLSQLPPPPAGGQDYRTHRNGIYIVERTVGRFTFCYTFDNDGMLVSEFLDLTDEQLAILNKITSSEATKYLELLAPKPKTLEKSGKSQNQTKENPSNTQNPEIIVSPLTVLPHSPPSPKRLCISPDYSEIAHVGRDAHHVLAKGKTAVELQSPTQLSTCVMRKKDIEFDECFVDGLLDGESMTQLELDKEEEDLLPPPPPSVPIPEKPTAIVAREFHARAANRRAIMKYAEERRERRARFLIPAKELKKMPPAVREKKVKALKQKRMSLEKMRHVPRELPECAADLHAPVGDRYKPWQQYIDVRKSQEDRMLRMLSGDLQFDVIRCTRKDEKFCITVLRSFMMGLLHELPFVKKITPSKLDRFMPYEYGRFFIDRKNLRFVKTLHSICRAAGPSVIKEELDKLLLSHQVTPEHWAAVVADEVAVKFYVTKADSEFWITNASSDAGVALLCTLAFPRMKAIRDFVTLEQVRIELLKSGIEPNPGPEFFTKKDLDIKILMSALHEPKDVTGFDLLLLKMISRYDSVKYKGCLYKVSHLFAEEKAIVDVSPAMIYDFCVGDESKKHALRAFMNAFDVNKFPEHWVGRWVNAVLLVHVLTQQCAKPFVSSFNGLGVDCTQARVVDFVHSPRLLGQAKTAARAVREWNLIYVKEYDLDMRCGAELKRHAKNLLDLMRMGLNFFVSVPVVQTFSEALKMVRDREEATKPPSVNECLKAAVVLAANQEQNAQPLKQQQRPKLRIVRTEVAKQYLKDCKKAAANPGGVASSPVVVQVPSVDQPVKVSEASDGSSGSSKPAVTSGQKGGDKDVQQKAGDSKVHAVPFSCPAPKSVTPNDSVLVAGPVHTVDVGQSPPVVVHPIIHVRTVLDDVMSADMAVSTKPVVKSDGPVPTGTGSQGSAPGPAPGSHGAAADAAEQPDTSSVVTTTPEEWVKISCTTCTTTVPHHPVPVIPDDESSSGSDDSSESSSDPSSSSITLTCETDTTVVPEIVIDACSSRSSSEPPEVKSPKDRVRPATTKTPQSSLEHFVSEATKQAELQQLVRQAQDAKDVDKQMSLMMDVITTARKSGYVLRADGPVLKYAFHGKFDPDMPSFEYSSDPLVEVDVFADGTWRTNALGNTLVLPVATSMIEVASRSVLCTNKVTRWKNIYSGLIYSDAVKAYVKQLDNISKIHYCYTLSVVAFVLTGLMTSGGKLRWMNECAEWVCTFYKCKKPVDWEKMLSDKNGNPLVFFAPDLMAQQASVVRGSRAAPFTVENLYPHIPDSSDFDTLIAGLCKRLFPDLTELKETARLALQAIARSLAEIIESRAQNYTFPGFDALLEHALDGRPAADCLAIREGVRMFQEDPKGATNLYLTRAYKAFIKKETYPEGEPKPPRFIMSMDLDARGIQIAAMAEVLWKIEVGTEEANVKHLTSDEITMKLKKKFDNCDLVAETDFSSFESCIRPELKAVVENQIFAYLAPPDSPTQDFIKRALGRKHVFLTGPGFTCPRFHHIRMSGDYWTSLGNLVTNICVIAFCTGRSVERILHEGIFEGDDGAFPFPDVRQKTMVEEKAKEAGVKLSFDIAPWTALSFCGNHFENVDGELRRTRNPIKALANLTTLFNFDPNSRDKDFGYQRSKCLSMLSGPWIRGASVFAAVVERVTRGCQVTKEMLWKVGVRLNEYSKYGLEGCVPQWLVYDHYGLERTDDDFCRVVAEQDRAAGGWVDDKFVKRMLDAARDPSGLGLDKKLPNPCFEGTAPAAWVYRDGLRFTHCKTLNNIDYVAVTNNNYFRQANRSFPLDKEFHRKDRVLPPYKTNQGTIFMFVLILISLITIIITCGLTLFDFIAHSSGHRNSGEASPSSAFDESQESGSLETDTSTDRFIAALAIQLVATVVLVIAIVVRRSRLQCSCFRRCRRL